jgi:hypothetical protein
VASLEIEDTGAKLNNDRRSIDDQKDDKWQEIRKDYNSDV